MHQPCQVAGGLVVAGVLQLPEATVRTRFARARRTLRAGLENDIDMTLEDVFAFDGQRCDRIVAKVLERGRGVFLR